MTNGQKYEDVGRITIADLVEIVAAGFRDFTAAPLFGIVFGGLFLVAGWSIIALLWVLNLPYLAYPLAMGFALVAPFAAVGFYAVSSLLEKGEKPTWSRVISLMMAAVRRDLRWMALVTGFALVIWMDIAAFLFFALMGFTSFGPALLDELFTTPTGLIFLALGNTSGAVIAVCVFSISVISFPLLFDKDVDFVTAMVASVRLVIANPVSMLIWCALIGVLVGLSLLSAFAAFFVVMPVIGHATWHLYRRAYVPAAVPDTDAAPFYP